MRVDLPDGGVAEIVAADEITEGMFRAIDRAGDKRIHVGAVLRERGYADPAEWGKDLSPEQIRDHPQNLRNTSAITSLTDEEDSAVRDYDLVVMSVLTQSVGEVALPTRDDLLGLKKANFDALLAACLEQVKGTVVDTSADEVPPNPKAPTDSSSD